MPPLRLNEAVEEIFGVRFECERRIGTLLQRQTPFLRLMRHGKTALALIFRDSFREFGFYSRKSWGALTFSRFVTVQSGRCDSSCATVEFPVATASTFAPMAR